jgi:hypothetical protein
MKKILLLILISGGFFFASISYAATYNITSQADLETYPIISTANDTVVMQNDITLNESWTPIGSFSGTFDGNGYSVSGIGNRVRKTATASNTANSYNLTSDLNLGQTHTITFRVSSFLQINTAFMPICKGTGDGLFFGRNANTTLNISYYAQNGYGVQWTTTNSSVERNYTLVRNGMTVTLYQGTTSLGAKTMPASGKSLTLNEIMRNITGTWYGKISNIGISNQALDTTWIAQQNNGGLGRLVTTANMPGAVFIANLQEGTGTIATDVVGGNNLSGIDGWEVRESAGGFIETINGSTIRNLLIDTPNIANNQTVNGSQGALVNLASGAFVIENVGIKNVTITTPYVTSNKIGGLGGQFYGGLGIIRNCWVSVASIPRTPRNGSEGFGWSGGILGYASGIKIQKCYVVGTNTSVKPDCGLVGYSTGGPNESQRDDSWVSMPVDAYVSTFWGGSYHDLTNFYYNNGGGGFYSMDNKGNSGTHIASASGFYNITQAPMNTWDFTSSGPWSPRLNTTTFPPLHERFSGDISGSITGIGTGKTVILSLPKRTGNRASISTNATLASTLNLGTVHTIAFTASIDIGARRPILRDTNNNTNQVGFSSSYGYAYTIGGTNYASGYTTDELSHRYVFVRNGSSLVIYRDNVVVLSSNSLPATGMDNLSQAFRGTFAGNFIGTADEMIITSDAKNAAWVATDWNGGSIKYYRPDETSLLNLWHFDEASGTTAVDKKSGNTITFASAPTWQSTFLSLPYYETLTTSDAFTFTGVSAMYGKPLIIYVFGDAIKSSLVSTTIEGTGNVTGIVMEQDTLSIGDTNLNPLISYATVLEIAPSAIADYCMRVASNVLYYKDGCDLLVPTGSTYTGTIIQNDTGETGSVTIDGTLTAITTLYSPTSINLNGTMPSSDVRVGGAFTSNVNVTADCHLTSYGSDIVNNLSVTNSANCQSAAFVMKGDLTNSGTFFSSSLSLQGTTQTITNTGTFETGYFDISPVVNLFGDMTFGYFTNTKLDALVTFEHGKTYEIGAFEDTGSSSGHELHFRSDTPGARYTIDNISGGALNTSFIDVQDSNVSTNDFYATRSINLGNNDNRETAPHWVFGKSINAFLLQYK